MSRYGVILATICFVDLLGTTLGVYFGYFGEANPMLNYFLLRYGLTGFIFIKIFFVVIPISVFEIAPKFNLTAQQYIKVYYRFTISAYVLVLVVSILFQSIAV